MAVTAGPIGMKSVSVSETPRRISKNVVRTFVPPTYCWCEMYSSCGTIWWEPPERRSSIRAKTLGLSNLGRHAQSIAPKRETSAPVDSLPISP